MATNTTHYNLEKPAQSDLYNVDVFNDNADKIDTALWGKSDASNLAVVEPTNTASKPYAVGEYLVLNGILYKVTQAIANGGALVVGTNIAQDNVGTELKSIKESLTPILTNDILASAVAQSNDVVGFYRCSGAEYTGTVPTGGSSNWKYCVAMVIPRTTARLAIWFNDNAIALNRYNGSTWSGWVTIT